MQTSESTNTAPTSTASRRIDEVPPFRSSGTSPVDVAARVSGALPAWLRGDLVRTAPALFELGAFRAAHWFDGLGMLYAFRLEADGTVRFRRRLLEGETYRAVSAGDLSHASFATPLHRSAFARLKSPVPAFTDNANVNVVDYAGERVALTETPHQVRFDPDTLEARGHVTWTDSLGTLATIAHPHFDFARGVVVNAASSFGPSPAIVFYEHAPSSRERRVVARYQSSRLPYLHAFGMTDKRLVLFGHPHTVSPLSMLWSNKAFIDHFRWKPEEGLRLVSFDRATGEQRVYETDAGFIFHVANSYEDRDATIVEAVVHDSAEVIDRLRTDRLSRGCPSLTAKHVRFVLEPGRTRATAEQASEARFEFPNVSYARRSARRHEVTWGAAIEPGSDGAPRAEVVRVERESGRVTRFSEDDYVIGEPVFVGEPGKDGEEEGVVMAVGTSSRRGGTRLFVLEPRTLEPLARVDVDETVPLGFHGQFFRART